MGRLAVCVRFGGAAWLLGVLGLLGLLAGPAQPGAVQPGAVLAGAVLAGAALALAATLLVRLVHALPVARAGTLPGPVLRARSADTATDPQRDPDAAGRPRPRAPSRDPLTA